MEIYYVYVHRRGDNNEVFYVGKGKKNRAYDKGCRNKWWNNIVAKYGFTVEFVEKDISEESALDLEKELIKFYRESGHELVNMTDGGEGVSGLKMSDENKEAMRQRMIGNTYGVGHVDSDETRLKKSKSRTGKKHSKETLKKIGKSHKKPVQCSNGMWFDSTVSAVEWLRSVGFPKASTSAINMCCLGRRKIAYGFSWTRAKLVLQLNDSAQEAVDYMAQSKDNRIKQQISVLFPGSVCFEEGEYQ